MVILKYCVTTVKNRLSLEKTTSFWAWKTLKIIFVSTTVRRKRFSPPGCCALSASATCRMPSRWPCTHRHACSRRKSRGAAGLWQGQPPCQTFPVIFALKNLLEWRTTLNTPTRSTEKKWATHGGTIATSARTLFHICGTFENTRPCAMDQIDLTRSSLTTP